MMNPEALKQEYEAIFNNKYIQINDPDRVLNFCKVLSMITGIQSCDKYGNVYDYIHEVYRSALKILEDEENDSNI